MHQEAVTGLLATKWYDTKDLRRAGAAMRSWRCSRGRPSAGPNGPRMRRGEERMAALERDAEAGDALRGLLR
jgi:hypothetical protein